MHALTNGLPRRLLDRIPASGAVAGSLASVVAVQLLLIVTGVITARALGPTDRGHLAFIALVPMVLHIAGSLGLSRAATYFIAANPDDEVAVLRALRLPVVLQAVVLTVLQVAILAAATRSDPREVQVAALVATPLLVAALGDLYGKAILQGQRRYGAFNVLRNASVFFNVLAILVALALGATDLLAFTVALTVAGALSAVVTLGTSLRHRRPPADHVLERRTVLRYGLRGYLISLSPVSTFRLDQATIGLFLAPASLGLYVVGLSFTNLPSFISRSIGLIAFPEVAGSQQTGRDDTHRFVILSIALSAGCVAVLELTAGLLVPFFFGEAFDGAVALTRILLIGAFLDGTRRVLTDTSSGKGRPGAGSIAEVVSWVVVVPSLALCVPTWGVIGVAVATTISAAVSLAALWLILRPRQRKRDRPGAQA